MLTTEPETSNHGEMTFLEHSYSIQVQQTALLMPELHTFIRPEDLTLNIKCQMSIVISPRLKGVEKETLPTLPLSKERYLASYSSPEAEQEQPCALESNKSPSSESIWQSSTRTAVKPSWGHLGSIANAPFGAQTLQGALVSLPAIYT